jgi:predicted lipoprotein
MKKMIKYFLGAIVVIFVGYNSVYFKRLSEIKKENAGFNASAYADKLVKEVIADSSKLVTFDQLIAEINKNKQNAFAQYGHALAIGSTRYFMTKEEGNVLEVKDSEVLLETKEKKVLRIATEFVYGNAIRDASGKVRLTDFSNTNDLNNISSEINKLVRSSVLPNFKATVKKGDKVNFLGALELNEDHLDLTDIELIPLRLSVNRS